MAEMDTQVAADLADHVALETLTVPGLVETTMRAFVKVYLRRPAFVEIYLRGRSVPAVRAFGRAHNARVATDLRALALDAGLARPDLTEAAAVFAVEVGDRLFQLAFERDVTGDAFTIEEGIRMVTAYLEGYTVPVPA
jgi:hypothetical protein